MPTYLETINRLLVEQAARHPRLVQYGENIAHGSRICGLARGLGGRVVTVGNCENAHVGFGLGMMLEGGAALLVVKQLDFLLLAADQLVNTMNLLRAPGQDPAGSFTILTIVCDQGWQGPQSSFHDLAGLAALARLDAYHLNGAGDAALVLERLLVAPGCRLIGVSQRLFGEAAVELPVRQKTGDLAELQYADGGDATIVALGFALPQALEAASVFAAAGQRAALFQVNPVLRPRWDAVTASAVRTGRLLLLDDAKGGMSLAHKIASAVYRLAPECRVTIHTREHQCETAVNADRFESVLAGVAE